MSLDRILCFGGQAPMTDIGTLAARHHCAVRFAWRHMETDPLVLAETWHRLDRAGS